LCAEYLPRSERVVSYHLLTEGSCWAQIAGDAQSILHVNAGELLVVPHGEAHVMGSSLDLAPVQAAPLLASRLQQTPGEVLKVQYGGGGAATRIICGFLACNETLSNPLLASLPRIFKIDMRNDPRAMWLQSSLEIAATEAAEWRAGSSIVLARLSELLFVEALRRCIEQLPADQKGWLAGARDRYVGRTLALLHAQPTRSWTVEELARQAGLSRSALAQRFTELLGQPPMQYLARWRLQIAGQELMMSSNSVAAIAARVGYDSEAAFSRAFKREFGSPPAAWRRTRAQQGTDGAARAASGQTWTSAQI
jgi:AraC family transcriptional regulator, alkane utilization regulator